MNIIQVSCYALPAHDTRQRHSRAAHTVTDTRLSDPRTTDGGGGHVVHTPKPWSTALPWMTNVCL